MHQANSGITLFTIKRLYLLLAIQRVKELILGTISISVMQYKNQEKLLDILESSLHTDPARPVLDLACGTGRSGLKLAERNIPVVFADRSSAALAEVELYLSKGKLNGSVWRVDLEKAGINPFECQVFSAVVCFRYLHRPLFPYLLNAVMPGGLVIYETFTTGNRFYGRPNNPDFLLEPEELKSWFQNWDILHYYEGVQHDPDRAIAQIIAKKPEVDANTVKQNSCTSV